MREGYRILSPPNKKSNFRPTCLVRLEEFEYLSPAMREGYRILSPPNKKSNFRPTCLVRLEEFEYLSPAMREGYRILSPPNKKSNFHPTCLVRLEEFESPTFGSVDQRSIQLSYKRIIDFFKTKLLYAGVRRLSIKI